jgi:diaminopimelate epimerase
MLSFTKYHGTGNDFILIDNRGGNITLSQMQVARLCHRRFGIGADGLMLLEKSRVADYKMVYYNADGGVSTLCGNGSRCMAAFARELGVIKGDKALFEAADGLHKVSFLSNQSIALEMADVLQVEVHQTHSILDTGSPHFVQWTNELEALNVDAAGREVRNSPRFKATGINVNFVQQNADGVLAVRTYERGVEAETLSCGTGVTAAAIASAGGNAGSYKIAVVTPGGNLEVTFENDTAGGARNVVLTGPAVAVFKGEVELEKL